jgi:hypothetical protein
MMPPSSPHKGGRRRLSAGMPRVFGPHKSPLGRAYRRWWLSLVSQHGQPVPGGAIEPAMSRAAVAGARLAMLTEAWAGLANRIRHTEKSRAELRAAEKAMGRADEALSRALIDLRAAATNTPTGGGPNGIRTRVYRPPRASCFALRT